MLRSPVDSSCSPAHPPTAVLYCTGPLLHLPALPLQVTTGTLSGLILPAPHCAPKLCLLPPPLQVTTGSDAYSFGVLMWTLYTGQQPFVISSGVMISNPLFPHFPKFGHVAHPPYTCLAERCLLMDPHERPTFAQISESLLDFFHRESVAPGPPQRPPAMSAPAAAAGSDGSIVFSSSQVSYIDSRSESGGRCLVNYLCSESGGRCLVN